MAGHVLMYVCVFVCFDVKVCTSVCMCVCVCGCTFCTSVPVLPVRANECEAGDYACVSKGTGTVPRSCSARAEGGMCTP